MEWKKEKAEDFQYETIRKDSNSKLRYKNIEKNSDLVGYRVSEHEKKAKESPKEAMRLENKYGAVSMGVNKKKEMTLVVTGKRNYSPSTEQNSKELKSEGAVKINGQSDKIFVNSENKQESAFVLKTSSIRNSKYVTTRLTNMMLNEKQSVGENMLPFLKQKEDKEKIGKLEELRRIYAEHMDVQGLELVDKQLTTLKYDMVHKKQEENLLINNVERGIEVMRKHKKKAFLEYAIGFIVDVAVGSITDDDEPDRDKNRNGKKEKVKNKVVEKRKEKNMVKKL